MDKGRNVRSADYDWKQVPGVVVISERLGFFRRSYERILNRLGRKSGRQKKIIALLEVKTGQLEQSMRQNLADPHEQRTKTDE